MKKAVTEKWNFALAARHARATGIVPSWNMNFALQSE